MLFATISHRKDNHKPYRSYIIIECKSYNMRLTDKIHSLLVMILISFDAPLIVPKKEINMTRKNGKLNQENRKMQNEKR